MSEKTVIVCDFCGMEKKATNNWFRIGFTDDHVSLIVGHSYVNWAGEAKDACGEKCVSTAVSRFLDRGTLEER